MAADEIRAMLTKHGWRHLGQDGKDEGWEWPDAAVCSFTSSGDWEIEQQWAGPMKRHYLATGTGAQELEESLKELRICDCCREKESYVKS